MSPLLLDIQFIVTIINNAIKTFKHSSITIKEERTLYIEIQKRERHLFLGLFWIGQPHCLHLSFRIT